VQNPRGNRAGFSASALLANAAVTTIACYLAVAVLERAGTDDMAEIELREPHGCQVWFCWSAQHRSATGTWGLWTRHWLFDRLAAVP
jgi:hypothetical protein